jgi:hypothetical protein
MRAKLFLAHDSASIRYKILEKVRQLPSERNRNAPTRELVTFEIHLEFAELDPCS